MKSSSSLNDRDDLVLVGRVVGVHGVRGSLKVHSYAESLSVYEAGEGILAVLPDGSVRTLTVEWVQSHGRLLLMALEGLADRSQAEILIGSELFVDKVCLPPLEEDTYYWSDLVGLRVYDTSGSLLGRLDEVIPTPGNDIYVVKGKQDGQTREMLIPAIGDVVLKIDLEGKTMIVDPPEGL
ncbi:ribosome maturation factor RimM [Desulfosarcina sp.]|uniref:ribosome maturation factor RimM n=1 Tax=Desulfosarcina sp. TaxID=2027861 RepID=UPI0029A66993|nr:ribosome maturation factor RimM [Desulfosarcina sp.]MDX2452566.1 ribosome maturation factor RimM [Desulfosarcina sp.]MDX2490336.1 ribosome maturation factor RimM [Desulfosarcina sp.]